MLKIKLDGEAIGLYMLKS